MIRHRNNYHHHHQGPHFGGAIYMQHMGQLLRMRELQRRRHRELRRLEDNMIQLHRYHDHQHHHAPVIPPLPAQPPVNAPLAQQQQQQQQQMYDHQREIHRQINPHNRAGPPQQQQGQLVPPPAHLQPHHFPPFAAPRRPVPEILRAPAPVNAANLPNNPNGVFRAPDFDPNLFEDFFD